MMLTALVKDLALLDGVEIVTTRDKRLSALGAPVDVVTVHEPGEFWSRLTELIRSADAVWPIAPESGGILARISEITVDAGRRRWDPLRALTTSKLATAISVESRSRQCRQHRLGMAKFRRASAWVVKPDDGAGAANTAVRNCQSRWLDWGKPKLTLDPATYVMDLRPAYPALP
jgi:hypothetical protein